MMKARSLSLTLNRAGSLDRIESKSYNAIARTSGDIREQPLKDLVITGIYGIVRDCGPTRVAGAF
jgi:hypothetical protein